MRVRTVEDPAAFLVAAEPLLLADEARHNLILGLGRTLADRPDLHVAFDLRLIESDDEVVGAALRTPPHNLVLAAPRHPDALGALSAALVDEGVDLPGVIGSHPEVRAFADLHAAAFGRETESAMEQGIYALETVADVPRPPGRSRRAAPGDHDDLFPWMRAFSREAGVGEPRNEERAHRRFSERLANADDLGLWIWEDDEIVSMAGYGGPTPGGLRVGPVYTPPRRRGRGYATALVADLSAHLLASGRRFLFLYTDMENPTSNAIYRRIGYRLVCRSAMISFRAVGER